MQGPPDPTVGSWLQDVRKPPIYCSKIEVSAEPVVGSRWQNMTFLFEGLHIRPDSLEVVSETECKRWSTMRGIVSTCGWVTDVMIMLSPCLWKPMCHAFHIGPTGVGDPNQLYFGENPDPRKL